MRPPVAELTLGPIFFNWQPETWRDFYFRVADETAVSRVYLGEVICSKRAPLFAPHCAEVIERLKGAGKAVVLSTLSEVTMSKDRELIESVCSVGDSLVEANDASALLYLQGRAHYVGPFVNVYNEETLSVLAGKGAESFCLAPELPGVAIRHLCDRAHKLNVLIEVQAFGRLSLALSGRCYHARLHDRTKDSCQFVCENDPDGLNLRTLDERAFLTMNGIQTLSHEYVNLMSELPELRALGVSRFRLSPHTCDMVMVASIFDSVIGERITADEGVAQLDAMQLPAPFANGFYHGKRGHLRVCSTAS